MSMKKKDDQRRFMGKCVEISSRMKMVASMGYHGIGNYGKFLEKFIKEVETLTILFEKEGF